MEFDDEQSYDDVDGPCDLSSSVNDRLTEETLEHLAKLESAIQNGNVTVATEMASVLSKKRPVVCVKADTSSCKALEDCLSITINIENKMGHLHSVVWKMLPSVTIRALKWRMYVRFGYSPIAQKWIIGRRPANDDDKLSECGITSERSAIFLYLMTPTSGGNSVVYDPVAGEYSRRHSDICQLSGLGSAGSTFDERSSIPQYSGNFHSFTERIPLTRLVPAAAPLPMKTEPQQVGWCCPVCTFINEPTRPGCEMCSGDRPSDYQPPADYRPSQRELMRLQEEQKHDELMAEETRRLMIANAQMNPEIGVYFSGDQFGQNFAVSERMQSPDQSRSRQSVNDEELAWALHMQMEMLASGSSLRSNYLDTRVEFDDNE